MFDKEILDQAMEFFLTYLVISILYCTVKLCHIRLLFSTAMYRIVEFVLDLYLY